MNLLSVFDSNVRKFPGKDFIRYNGHGISYTETRQKSERVAAWLQSKGIGPGHTVAMFCYNSPSFIYFMLGAWRAGAAVVPVNHKLKTAELQYILSDSEARVLLFDAQLAGVVNGLAQPVLSLCTEGSAEGHLQLETELLTQQPGTYSTPENSDLAQVLYTSGTTGNPKGCMLTHDRVCMAAITAALGLSMTRHERTLMAMPVWHSSPLNNWLGGTLYVGGTIVLLREYHPLHFLQAIQNEKISLYFGAPVSLSLPLRMIPDFASYDLSGVRAWIYGGGPISAELSKKLMESYGSTRFYQVFGMTETGPTGMVLYPEEQISKAGSIGKYALPAVDIRVVDEQGNDIPENAVGEIWMKAPSLMQGYLHNEEATREAFSGDGWYKTGDLARKDEDGYLFVVDRKKDMIITGGENVYSKQVEDVILQHPDVEDAAVIGIPNEEWGETVAAVIVRKAGTELREDSLRQFLQKNLAAYRVPRVYYFTDVLPRTPSGKIQKHLLRSQFSE